MSTVEERARRAAYMRAWTEKNKERLNAERRARRKTDPEYREKNRVACSKRYYSHPNEVRAYRKLWREKNREHKNAKSREYYHNNPEKERTRAKIKNERLKQKRLETFIAKHGCTPSEYRERTKSVREARLREQHRTANARYLEKHRDEINARARGRRKLYPERVGIYSKNRKARKRGAPGSYNLTEWKELCAKYDNRCVRCGERKELQADHVIPVTSPRSTNYISNIQPLCGTCNKIKMKKTIDYRPLWGNKIMWCNHAED